ncbi:MAG: CvpA family protein [Bryobacteraceae bacterium]|jgi:membrane protein required for colicin V production
MTFLDFILLAVIIGFTAKGLSGGFARVGVGFIASIAGIFCAFWSYGITAAWIMPYVNSRPLANLLGFLIILIGFGIAGSLIGHVLARIFRWAGLSWFDHLGGAAFGLLQGLVVAVALVTVILACAPTPTPDMLARSRVVPYLLGPSNAMAAMIPRELRESFEDTTGKVRRMWPQHPDHQDGKNK